MLSLLDTPAYAMLSTKYMNEVFNPRTPNVEGVKYYSVASRTPSLAIWHPLWLPKLILDAAAESRTAKVRSMVVRMLLVVLIRAMMAWSVWRVPSGESSWALWKVVIIGTCEVEVRLDGSRTSIHLQVDPTRPKRRSKKQTRL